MIEINVDLNKYSDWFSEKAPTEKLQRAFQKAVDDTVEDVADRFEDKIIDNALAYGISNENTIIPTIYFNEDGFEVVFESPIVQYVEYGVGIVGSANPHPNPPAGWQYNSGNQRPDGLWYYKVPDGNFIYPYMYTSDGTKISWTRGHEAKPFIYDSWLWARRSIHNIARGHINREFKKVGAKF